MEICTRIASGQSLRTIDKDPRMPGLMTIVHWLAKPAHAEFARQYARAREAQADLLAAEIVEIANTPVMGVRTKTNEKGEVETIKGDMIEHRRLQVDARKWYASKLAPKKYGERLELAGEVAVKRSAAEMTDDDLTSIATGRAPDGKDEKPRVCH